MNGVFNFSGTTIKAWGVGARLGGPDSPVAQCGAAVIRGVFGADSGFRGDGALPGGFYSSGFWAWRWAMILWGFDTPDVS